MNKTIYLIHGLRNESYIEFSSRMMQLVNTVAEESCQKNVKLVYTAEAPPAISIIPFKKKMIASVSIFSENEDMIPVDQLVNSEGFAGAYGVSEVLPVAYVKNWPDGELTPGICLLTLFNRKKGIDYKTFIDRWHNSHTPLSLRIHPLWNYSRNVVEKLITETSTPYEGIVEEQMQTDAELLNPFRFFGNPWFIIPRMISVYRDTKAFLDYSRIETYLAREIIIKS